MFAFYHEYSSINDSVFDDLTHSSHHLTAESDILASIHALIESQLT